MADSFIWFGSAFILVNSISGLKGFTIAGTFKLDMNPIRKLVLTVVLDPTYPARSLTLDYWVDLNCSGDLCRLKTYPNAWIWD
jgi:hypothetical protein